MLRPYIDVGSVNDGLRMIRLQFSAAAAFIVLNLLASTARSQEVYVGNPGKSLNFFHFDLAIERGFFKELGLDV